MIIVNPPYAEFMFYLLICSLLFTNLEVYGYFHSSPVYSERIADHILDKNVETYTSFAIANKNKSEDLVQYSEKEGIIGKRVEQNLKEKRDERYLLPPKDADNENKLTRFFVPPLPYLLPKKIYTGNTYRQQSIGKYLRDHNGEIFNWSKQKKYERSKENNMLDVSHGKTDYPFSNAFSTDKIQPDQILKHFNPHYHKQDEKSPSLIEQSLPDYVKNADVKQLLQNSKPKNELRYMNSRKKYDEENAHGDFVKEFISKRIVSEPDNMPTRFQEENIMKAHSEPQDYSPLSPKYSHNNVKKFSEPSESWKGSRINYVTLESQLFDRNTHDINSRQNKLLTNKHVELDSLTKHQRGFRVAEKGIQKNYSTENSTKTTENQMPVNRFQDLKVFRKTLKVQNRTSDLQNSSKNDDYLRIQIYHINSKNILNRQRKELKTTSSEINSKTVKEQRSRREESLLILKVLGISILVIIFVACIAFCINQWSKNRKRKKYDETKEETEHPNYTDETELNKASSQTILKQNNSHITSFSDKTEKYVVESRTKIVPMDRKEKPMFETGASKHESLESVARSKSVTKTGSLSRDVSKNYSTKKQSYQNMDLQTRSDFENIIMDKTYFFESSNDSSCRSSETTDNPVHYTKKSYLNLEESISNKGKKSSDFFNNNIVYKADSFVYDLDYVKPKTESKDSEEVLAEVIVEKGQNFLTYEDGKNISTEKTGKHQSMRSSSVEQQKFTFKQSKDSLGSVFSDNDNADKLSSSSDTEQYLQFQNVNKEKVLDHNISDVSGILYPLDENRIGSPWQRILLNVNPLYSQRSEKHNIKKKCSETEQQKAISQQSEYRLNSVKSESNEKCKQRSSLAFYQHLYPSLNSNKDIRNETLKIKREKKFSDRDHPWKRIIDNLKKTRKFNRPMMISKFMI